MIDIIGNLKIDETRPERIKYFIASLRSYRFLDAPSSIIISLENPSEWLFNITLGELRKLKCSFTIKKNTGIDSYGLEYVKLLRECKNEIVLNFIEDAFMLIDSQEELNKIVECLHVSKGWSHLIKACFWQIEQNSCAGMHPIATSEETFTFKNSPEEFREYQKHYGSRYYIGVNFIIRRDYALLFWSRHLGKRPHEYEIPAYHPTWEHNFSIPRKEITASIDDDHGEPNTCLLKRQDEKFWEIYNKIETEFVFGGTDKSIPANV